MTASELVLEICKVIVKMKNDDREDVVLTSYAMSAVMDSTVAKEAEDSWHESREYLDAQ